MALSDRQRHDAYEALTEAFADRTDLVIEMLRPAHDLATTSDIESVRFALSADIESTRQELRSEITATRHELGTEIAATRRELGNEIANVRADLEGQIIGFRTEVTAEFATVRHEMAAMGARLELSFEQRIHEAFAAQTRTLMLGLVAAFLLTALTNVLTLVLG